MIQLDLHKTAIGNETIQLKPTAHFLYRSSAYHLFPNPPGIATRISILTPFIERT